MIRINDLHKSFGLNKVLQGINLHIQSGETLAIIGQSGSGKSVLLKHMLGLIQPDRGSIIVDGVEICGSSEAELNNIRRKFGLLFQASALFDSLTVAQNVSFGLERYRAQNVSFGLERYRDLSQEELQKKVKQSLAMVGLRGIEQLMPHELSGGMKKRVGLARAIAYEPKIMLYDEPSTGIDPIRADAINELMITSVVITHDMTSAYKVADRIAMLYNGIIVTVGTPEELRKSDNQIVQQFIHGQAEGPIKEW